MSARRVVCAKHPWCITGLFRREIVFEGSSVFSGLYGALFVRRGPFGGRLSTRRKVRCTPRAQTAAHSIEGTGLLLFTLEIGSVPERRGNRVLRRRSSASPTGIRSRPPDDFPERIRLYEIDALNGCQPFGTGAK
jgi:hypothetical protein